MVSLWTLRSFLSWSRAARAFLNSYNSNKTTNTKQTLLGSKYTYRTVQLSLLIKNLN